MTPKKQLIIDALFLLSAFFCFFLYFEPKYLFSPSTITGGDIASHYHLAEYLKNVLLPQGKIMGWTMDNFCGYPLFYHYFPLPFIFTAVFGYFFPLAICFKLISVSGVFFFPLAVYLMFRFLRYEFPVPIIASLFSLAYLFNPWQSLWGGNIMSVLAGEFCQSFSMLFFLVAIGSLYRGVEENKYLLLNGILIALMASSHGVPISLFVVISSFFLFNRSWQKNLWYLIRMYGLGFLLIAYWFIPFLFNIPFTTPLSYAYAFTSFWEVFPPILMPFYLLSIYTIVIMLKVRIPRLKSGVLFPTLQCGVTNPTLAYFLFILTASFFLGLAAPRLGLIDSRYFTFVQLFLTLIGAISLPPLFRDNKQPIVFIFLVFLTIGLWVKVNSPKINNRIAWNYSGIETRASWPDFVALTNYLRQTPNGGRVAVENTTDLIEFGTPRIFESLKSFAGRDTLKGLLVSSSITTPFIRQIEGEISNNPKLAAVRLRECAATQLIARTDKLKKELKTLVEYKFEKRFGSCEVYRVVESNPRYIPRAQTEKIGNETIEFTTSHLNRPHLIKISYHPNWVVTGADKIYRVKPGFMMVQPKEQKVKLEFKSFWKSVGR